LAEMILLFPEFSQPELTGELHVAEVLGDMLDDMQNTPAHAYRSVSPFPEFF